MNKVNKYRFQVEKFFKVIFLILGFLSFNVFFAHTPELKLVSYATAAFGVLVILMRLFVLKDFKKSTGIWLLLTMLFFCGISSLTNYKYGQMSGLIENAQGMIWMGLDFFALFAYNQTTTLKQLKSDFTFFTSFMLVYNLIANIISIVMMFKKYRLVEIRNNSTVLGGFLWNRLWGIYTDPNHGSVLAAVCIVISLYYIIKKVKWSLILFHCVNIAASLFYLVCSDSRTGAVVFVAGTLIFSFLVFVTPNNKNNATKIAISICLAVIVGVGTFGLIKVTKSSINKVQTYAVKVKHENENSPTKTDNSTQSSNNSEQKNNATVALNEEISKATVGRKEDIEKDVSNNRFNIWKSGYEVFKCTPVFGTSFREMNPYAKENLPETFIAKAGFTCMHNSIFDIIVSQGLVGLIVFIAFAVLVIVKFIKMLWKINDKESFRFASILFTVISILTCSSVFISSIVYINCFICVIFWTMLGYAMNLSALTEKAKIPQQNEHES